MMKNYEKPIVEEVLFTNVNTVLTLSGDLPSPETGPNELPLA